MSQSRNQPRPGSGLRVTMALYGDLTFDSRVLREARALAEAGVLVTVMCLRGTTPMDGSFQVIAHVPDTSDVLPIDVPGQARQGRQRREGGSLDRARWAVGYARNLHAWGSWALRYKRDTDVWHVHDLPGLLAVGGRAPATLVYDSHELFLETGSAARLPGTARRLLAARERRLSKRVAAVITVNEQLADLLEVRLEAGRPIVVRNTPPRQERSMLEGSPLRQQLGLGPDAPLFIYHGAISPDRGIEVALAALAEPGVESAHLVVLGYGPMREALRSQSREGPLAGRLHVVDAVPSEEVPIWVAGADAGMVLIQPSSLNHRLATPNKLWECIAAGVPVIASDLPAMRSVVLDDPEGPLGLVCEPTDPASVAIAMRQLASSPPGVRQALRERCLRAAHVRWNWEVESVKLVELYAHMDLRSKPA